MPELHERKTFKKGTVIFREGDLGNAMYDIRWGTVGVYSKYGTPEQKKLTDLGPGEYFGEMGLLEYLPRSATVVALEDKTQVIEITLDGFSEYFNKQPAKIVSIMEHLCQRLRLLTVDYVDACNVVDEVIGSKDAFRMLDAGLQKRMTAVSSKYRSASGR